MRVGRAARGGRRLGRAFLEVRRPRDEHARTLHLRLPPQRRLALGRAQQLLGLRKRRHAPLQLRRRAAAMAAMAMAMAAAAAAAMPAAVAARPAAAVAVAAEPRHERCEARGRRGACDAAARRAATAT